MAKVTFSPKSRQDLLDIGEYIARDSRANARRFVAKLMEQCQRIGNAPMGYVGREDLAAGLRASGECLERDPDGFPQTYEVMPGNTLDNGTPDDETREKRIEGPPLPSASGPTAGFAQPAGCGGAPRAVRNLASPSHGDASSNGQIASLDCHPSL